MESTHNIYSAKRQYFLIKFIKISNSMQQSLKHQVSQLVEKFPAFYEPRTSLQCSQKPVTGPHLGSDESHPQHYNQFI